MSQRPRRATILEVASAAGVSKTSVSRYYSGERDRLSADMSRRIVAAAERLGYQPNPMARGLKGGPSGLIGMLVADIRNPFSVAVMHGVEQACREQGLSLMVCNTDNDPEQERKHLALLSSYRIEGLVVNAAGRYSEALSQLADGGTPVVLLDRALAGVDADEVGLDNAAAVDMALDHLIAQGYRRLLFITEPPAQASSRQARLDRFQARCADHRLAGETLSTDLGDDDALAAALDTLIPRDHDDQASGAMGPAAILCGNGQVTLAMTRCCHRRGITLGPLGLMGIDELDWCDLVGPGITTLAQPTDDIGQAALDALRNRPASQAGHAPRRLLFAPRLIARGSTQLSPG